MGVWWRGTAWVGTIPHPSPTNPQEEMFVLLERKSQLIEAIAASVHILPGKQAKTPPGTVVCRDAQTGEFIFMSQVESKTNRIFWNGDGTSSFYKFVPKVEIEFESEVIAARVSRIVLRGKELDVSRCILSVAM